VCAGHTRLCLNYSLNCNATAPAGARAQPDGIGEQAYIDMHIALHELLSAETDYAEQLRSAEMDWQTDCPRGCHRMDFQVCVAVHVWWCTFDCARLTVHV
jgi:hypothetical protein